jgi:dipeptidyl aminopeptidase/acylaminoacyl peptidase
MRNPLFALLILTIAAPAAADIARQVANNGNLVMEDIPAIPADIVTDLNRYQNVRQAEFRTWDAGGEGLFITTRFGDVEQIHRLDTPGGARRQLTYYREPIGEVRRRPGTSNLAFTRDAGGSEFAQVFLLDPASGDATLLSDGESRNSVVLFDRDGRRVAYQSTRRNGAANDIWIMDPERPDSAELALESQDGSWWGPVEFSESGSRMLVMNYVSITDSRVNLLDLDTGELTLLAGGGQTPSVNQPLAFDDANEGFWFITDQAGEFNVLAWQSLAPGARPEFVTADIPWNVDGGAISDDRRRAAFTVNEGGRTAVYLLDPRTRKYRRVDSIPVGLVFGIQFSPDGRRLAMTINTASSPSDTYVLDLGKKPLDYGDLTRWTFSEVGGLDTSAFREPDLIEFPSFDSVDGEPRKIPAWLYKPEGPGPHPVVISIHGGPEGQARPGFSSTYQLWLEKLGVAVLVPNVRGSAGYGKTYVSLDNGFNRED